MGYRENFGILQNLVHKNLEDSIMYILFREAILLFAEIRDASDSGAPRRVNPTLAN